MATTAGICNSFKLDLLAGTAGTPQALSHVFGTDVFKLALLLLAGTASPSTVTNYSSISGSGELAATGNYTAGGNAITLPAPAANSNSAIVGATTSVVWSALTSSAAFDGALLYNFTKSGKAVALFNFGSQTITAGTLTLTMPAAAAGTALLELA